MTLPKPSVTVITALVLMIGRSVVPTIRRVRWTNRTCQLLTTFVDQAWTGVWCSKWRTSGSLIGCNTIKTLSRRENPSDTQRNPLLLTRQIRLQDGHHIFTVQRTTYASAENGNRSILITRNGQHAMEKVTVSISYRGFLANGFRENNLCFSVKLTTFVIASKHFSP